MAKKSLAEIFLYPKRRAYVARMTLEWLDLKTHANSPHTSRPSNPPRRPNGIVADGDGSPVMP
jgi:hypothetical protein